MTFFIAIAIYWNNRSFSDILGCMDGGAESVAVGGVVSGGRGGGGAGGVSGGSNCTCGFGVDCECLRKLCFFPLRIMVAELA